MISGKVAVLLFFLIGQQVWAESARLDARVVRTLVDSEFYGGCMMQVDVALPLPNCRNYWLSFSCTGDFNPPEVGYRKLDAAQLALVTKTPVSVIMEDNKLHNGFCFARRIDNYAAR